MTNPQVVSQAEWLEARKRLLIKEKEATKTNDALRAERQTLPMVQVEKDYTFESSNGPVSLLELFGERPQLIVQHFMFDPEWQDGCSSCSYAVDTLGPGHLKHLQDTDTAFVIVSRAPIEKLLAWKEKKGWDLPWVSSNGNDFNWDFHASIDPSVAPVMVNFRDEEEMAQAGMKPFEGELPGYSVFWRDGDSIYHTYSTFARGVERLVSSTQFLDLTPLGRQS